MHTRTSAQTCCQGTVILVSGHLWWLMTYVPPPTSMYCTALALPVTSVCFCFFRRGARAHPRYMRHVRWRWPETAVIHGGNRVLPTRLSDVIIVHQPNSVPFLSWEDVPCTRWRVQLKHPDKCQSLAAGVVFLDYTVQVLARSLYYTCERFHNWYYSSDWHLLTVTVITLQQYGIYST